MTNIASILERRLGASRVELLRTAARAALDLGVPLYLVGGSVRDALLGGLKHRCDTPHPSPLPQGEREQGATDLDVSFVVVPAEAGTQGRGHEDTPHPSPLPQGERGLDTALAGALGGRPRRRYDGGGVAEALAEALGGVAESPSQFGTAKLRVGGVSLDLVMARRESYAEPGALPTVEPGSLADDLERRDFSINAMAVSLSAESWGDLADPFDGAGDL